MWDAPQRIDEVIMAMQTVSTRFDDDTIARLGEIATNQARSRSDIIQEAVIAYLNSYAWLEDKVKQAEDDFAHGRAVSHDDIKSEFRKLGVDVD